MVRTWQSRARAASSTVTPAGRSISCSKRHCRSSWLPRAIPWPFLRSGLSGVNNWIRPVRFVLYSGREGHEVDQPLLSDESRAVDRAAVKPRLPAEADRRHPGHRRRGDFLEDHAGRILGRLGTCTPDGVGGVPGAQPWPHPAEEAFGAQDVEPDPLPREIDEASDLPGLGFERFAGVRDRPVVALEDVVHGAHGGPRVELAFPGGEALPYICLVALMTPAEAQGISHLSRLVRAQRRVERGAAGGEAGAPVGPAAGLQAAERDG